MMRISEKGLKRKLPFFIAVLVMLAIIGGIIGYHVNDEYHTYLSSAVRDYETTAQENGSYVLETEKKELLGKVYVGFSVKDKTSGQEIYHCPDLYLVSDLESVNWKEAGDSIIVNLKDGGVREYIRSGKIWKKSEISSENQ